MRNCLAWFHLKIDSIHNLYKKKIILYKNASFTLDKHTWQRETLHKGQVQSSILSYITLSIGPVPYEQNYDDTIFQTQYDLQ